MKGKTSCKTNICSYTTHPLINASDLEKLKCLISEYANIQNNNILLYLVNMKLKAL